MLLVFSANILIYEIAVKIAPSKPCPCLRRHVLWSRGSKMYPKKIRLQFQNIVFILYLFGIIDVDIFLYKLGQTLRSLTFEKIYMPYIFEQRECLIDEFIAHFKKIII